MRKSMGIRIRNITRQFGSFKALDDVSLDIDAGELVALLGPSGCGKTTLLRIIAGLESSDGGAILFSDRDITHVHVRERQVGFVFQHYALFRHMTVADNIAFGLTVRPRRTRPPRAQVAAKVADLLRLVHLEGLAGRFPSQLSGGQRQRVALARALAVEPKVLLLDEPFGALDAKVRKDLRRWLRALHDELHVTSIFVTHDQEEAFEVADRVVVMNAGRIEQVGTPQAMWEQPASPFVYGFLGHVNTFREAGGLAFVRPHELDVRRAAPGAPGIVAELRRALVIGPLARLELSPGGSHQPMPGSGGLIEAHIPAQQFRDAGFREGESLVLIPRKTRVFADG